MSILQIAKTEYTISSDELHKQNIHQSIFHHHPDTIFTMDLVGNIISCNKSIEGFLGYSSNEIHGLYHALVKKEDLDRVSDHVQLAVGGQVQQYNCSCIHKAGHYVEVTVTNIPMFSNGEVVGIYGIAKDISKLIQTETRLKESETQFQQIYESLNLGVWSWDIRARKVVYVSSGIETLSGIKKEDFMNGSRDWIELIHPEDLKCFEQSQMELRKGENCIYQYRIVDSSGEIKWVEARTFPILDSDGALVRLDGLVTDIHNKKLEYDQINYYAYHDYLTDLPNRRLFEEKLERLVRNYKEEFVLFYLDLDRFKFVNDTLGHSGGDQLLKEAAKRLGRHLTENDLLVRLGGDEFAIILTNCHPKAANEVALKIQREFESPFIIQDYHLHITNSIGIGIFPRDGRTMNELCANTDIALYRAKGLGKNNIQFYTPSMTTEFHQQFLMVNDLMKAIQEEQFILHYQPKVDPKTRKIKGAEALIRWNHPERGILPPDHFIPLAEETNLIIDLGDWVIGEVCKQIKQWLDGGNTIVPISINISAKRFLKDDLVSKLQMILAETNIDPKWLEFEITETSLIQNEIKVLATINALKESGIAISLDDFGTGYSSINYLKKFKVDFLKIDRSFINAIHSSFDDEAIIKSILYLAQELKIKVVAEGVETEEQLDFLLKHKCSLIQGYLFSKPVDVAAFSQLLSKSNDWRRINT
ncbi:EAL domain-containing protein [Neobacillus citreus]|uniref:EAL domain-containing protein n=1 Tax=Neobacillus citreus TaxID=2833578 RepID=A0A942T0E3_9BACI|nr:EAL domain-containing protein [Neobacillus citreus]